VGKPTLIIKNMAQYKPRTEFATALAQVAAERGIDPKMVISSIQEAILAAYRRDAKEREIVIGEDEIFEVDVDNVTGEEKIYRIEGKRRIDVTPPGFGRIAAQTARNVIQQKIREAEKSAVMDEYSNKIGMIVPGMILRFDGPNIIVDIVKTEAVMPPSEQVKNEGYHLNQRLTFLVLEIREGPRGKQIVVSRTAKGLVEALFKREVPEVAQGSVEIREIAREPGARTKIAVYSNRSGVDPVGSCVGQKGARVQQVIEELMGERIDVIQWSDDTEKFIASALSPADGLTVIVDQKNKTAMVIVPDDKLSLSIGKEGQNVRLAAKITGYKIDIKGATEVAKTVKTGKKEAKEASDFKKTKTVKSKKQVKKK
jgi:transcription termination/antitermination protein NusA